MIAKIKDFYQYDHYSKEPRSTDRIFIPLDVILLSLRCLLGEIFDKVIRIFDIVVWLLPDLVMGDVQIVK